MKIYLKSATSTKALGLIGSGMVDVKDKTFAQALVDAEMALTEAGHKKWKDAIDKSDASSAAARNKAKAINTLSNNKDKVEIEKRNAIAAKEAAGKALTIAVDTARHDKSAAEKTSSKKKIEEAKKAMERADKDIEAATKRLADTERAMVNMSKPTKVKAPKKVESKGHSTFMGARSQVKGKKPE